MELLLWVLHLCPQAVRGVEAGGHGGDGRQGHPRQERPRGGMGQDGTNLNMDGLKTSESNDNRDLPTELCKQRLAPNLCHTPPLGHVL